jgi:LuxR family maltose regulon positive regulatory protein
MTAAASALGEQGDIKGASSQPMTTSISGLAQFADRGHLSLLTDKLEVPAIGLAVIGRPRVMALMDEATAHRVTVVTGPAGAGKTVACAGWAAAQAAAHGAPSGHSAGPGHGAPSGPGAGPGHGAAAGSASVTGSRIAWLTVDEGDRAPARFWRYVIAALARAGALSPADADQLASSPGHEGIAQELLARLSQADPATGTAGTPGAAGTPAGTATTMVVDDVHKLAGSEVIASLDELVHHAPDGFRLVISGRYAPGLALAKLRVSGQVGDVGPADLACTSQEAEAYLTSMTVTPDHEARAQIMRQTEGWMAGLRLLSMTMSPAGEPAEDAGQLISDYLCDEILAPLPAGTRDLLLRTCLTETIPADLARELTQDSAAPASIDQLCRENGLIRALGPGLAEYRYHPMLRDALQTVLRREFPAEVPQLLGRIARWHAGRDEILAALRAAAQGGDWDFGAEMLRACGPVVPAAADWAELEKVLASFPPDRRSAEPALAAALAAARLWQDDADGALPHLDCARGSLPGLAGTERAAVELWLAALQVMRVAPGGVDLTEYWAQATRAHEESRSVPEHRAAGLLWLALGCASLRRLQAQQAGAALQHASSQLAAGGLGLVRERGRAWEAVAHACYGDLATATRVAAEVSEGPAGGPELAPILAISQAIAHLARDEPEAAAILLDQADQATGGPQPAGEPAIGVLTGMARIRVAIGEGNLAGARGLVRLLAEMTAGEGQASTAVALLDAELSLAAGERDRAEAALGGVQDDTWPQAVICRARLLMAEADDKEALKLLEPVVASPANPANLSVQATLSDRLTALLTVVMAHRRLNQAAEAAERLAEALALAEPDDQSGPFIAAGSPIRSALTVLITPASAGAGFAARILDRFDGRMPHGGGQPSGAALTESELAVLRFLPSHMTNQEIAESLFLSINTIKTHLSSVYRKLGVTSRRQAIAQGRRLDLL